ncbi:heme NO-binding domain-containing protein [Gymnodinialimonas ceratoperidinii]|uniref:Heme NO-binding domain-containing protein n=1 Tax=Gymnodinialimonas ceratoperidinii TaxID=2856823 RepID=A0A8F6TYU2_9RHOB|nr:heme NO-binding domain-containing protein [Gymnodinialimonas ceratoperidinii]QXT40963.1 heme NO-binding domain-containing protein [Gymnodinialimonas ceratoperidinii]
MINRALQGFVIETYGKDVWDEVRSVADLRFDEFEAMLRYEDALTLSCFNAVTQVMSLPEISVLEDLGIYLITHPPLDPLRRLLRFGGASFTEFILSLDELAERGRMAIPDIELPEFSVRQIGPDEFEVTAHWSMPGIGGILLGALRAMADDYGALAILNLEPFDGRAERLTITIHDTHHAAGRQFLLAEAGP